MPSLAIPNTFATSESPISSSKMNANFSAVATLLNTTKLDAENIQAGAITNALVSASAAIAYSKLAALTDGYILVGNASNVAAAVLPSGDVTISNAGVFSIAASSIVNADVSASAAIAYSKLNLTTSIVNADVSASAAIAVSKLAAGTSAQVLLNTAAPTPTWTTLSGDVTVGATGTTAIGSGKVTNAMLASGAQFITETSSDTATNVITNTEVTVARTSFTAPASGRVKVTVFVNQAGNTGTNGAYTDVSLRLGTNSTHASNGIVKSVRIGGFGSSAVGAAPVQLYYQATVTPSTTYYLTLTGGTSSGTGFVGTASLSPALTVLVEALA